MGMTGTGVDSGPGHNSSGTSAGRAASDVSSSGNERGYSMHDQARSGLSTTAAAKAGYDGTSSAANSAGGMSSGSRGGGVDYDAIRANLKKQGWAFTGPHQQYGYSSGIVGIGRSTNIGGYDGQGGVGPYHDAITNFVSDAILSDMPSAMDMDYNDIMASSVVRNKAYEDPSVNMDLATRAVADALDQGIVSINTKTGALERDALGQYSAVGAHKVASPIVSNFMMDQAGNLAKAGNMDAAMGLGITGALVSSMLGPLSIGGVADLASTAVRAGVTDQAMIDSGMLDATKDPSEVHDNNRETGDGDANGDVERTRNPSGSQMLADYNSPDSGLPSPVVNLASFNSPLSQYSGWVRFGSGYGLNQNTLDSYSSMGSYDPYSGWRT